MREAYPIRLLGRQPVCSCWKGEVVGAVESFRTKVDHRVGMRGGLSAVTRGWGLASAWTLPALLALSLCACAQPERLLSRPLEQGDLETTIHEADSVSRPAVLAWPPDIRWC